MRRGSISRPLYVPQVGQTWCGRFGEPHCGHELTRGASILCCARRWSRRAFDVFLFGTAMSARHFSRIACSRRLAILPDEPQRSHDDGLLGRKPHRFALSTEGGPSVLGTLAAREISKSFGAVQVLDRVSLAVEPGDRVGIVGPNGIGKSTLLRLLAGLEPPDAGRVVRAGAVGYLPQEPEARPGESVRDYL